MLPHLPLPLPPWPLLLLALLVAGSLAWRCRRWWLAALLLPVLGLCGGLIAGWWQVVQLPTFGLVVAIAVLALLPWARRRAARAGIGEAPLLTVLLVAGLAAVIGARLWYWAEFGQQRGAADPAIAWWQLSGGGLVLYGGLVAGCFAGLATARWQRLPTIALLDALAPVLLAGIAIGRIGCFANGCCFGAPCELPWGLPQQAWQMDLVDGRLVWTSIEPYASRHHAGHEHASDPAMRFHPTQLYAALAVALLAGMVARYGGRTGSGRPIALAALGYGCWRLGNEALRGDNPADPLLGSLLTRSQGVSILLIAGGLLGCWLSRRRGPDDPA